MRVDPFTGLALVLLFLTLFAAVVLLDEIRRSRKEPDEAA